MRMIIRNKNKGFTLIELMIVVAIVGVLAVLAVVGVTKYLASAKTAEARNSLGAMGKAAAQSLEREASSTAVLAGGATAAINRRLCISATAAVPANVTDIADKKYQANSSPTTDYNKDSAADHTGFACLKFSLKDPQRYQYNYVSDATAAATGTAITATAIGDLNGNATYSTFRYYGTVQNGTLALAPSYDETNPDE